MADKNEAAHNVEEEATHDLDNDEEFHKNTTSYSKYRLAVPMKEPLTAAWGLAVSDADLAKLKVGCLSRDMEDKWNIFAEDPDPNGKLSIHCHRSWTGYEMYALQIAVNGSSGGSTGVGAEVETITWEGNMNNIRIDAEQARKETVLLLRGRLGCEFEGLPEYDFSVVWDHPAYKIKPDEEHKKFDDLPQASQQLFHHSLGY